MKRTGGFSALAAALAMGATWHAPLLAEDGKDPIDEVIVVARLADLQIDEIVVTDEAPQQGAQTRVITASANAAHARAMAALEADTALDLDLVLAAGLLVADAD
ncbi:MAG: hypothetical protein AAGF46_01490 [Pseudomonadota bacterium]